jgi:hypothetical protein
MNTPAWLLALALLTPLASLAEDNALSPAERAAGWQLLFDGRTLEGWRGLKATAPGDGWAVLDGAIVRTHPSGDLLTVGEYGDFELAIDWKVEDATNSGILYRVGLGEDFTYHTGPEYQILDNRKARDNRDPKHLAGALYDLVAPSRDVTQPVGEWNQTRIVVRGWHIEHWLNGVKIVDVDLADPAGRSLIAGSKFKAMPRFATLIRGHIALQDHDDSVWYRNIRIRELSGAERTP